MEFGKIQVPKIEPQKIKKGTASKRDHLEHQILPDLRPGGKSHLLAMGAGIHVHLPGGGEVRILVPSNQPDGGLTDPRDLLLLGSSLDASSKGIQESS